MNAVDWLFDGGHSTGRKSDAIRWWEVRRVPYNLIVGFVGLASIVVMEIVGEMIVHAGEDFEEPLGLLLGVFMMIVIANVAYTFGWILEVSVSGVDAGRRHQSRVRRFKKILGWSCLCASLPAWLSLLLWLVHKA